MMRGGQQQRQHSVAGLVIEMEAVAAVPELVRDGQYIGEGRTLSKCHGPLETKANKKLSVREQLDQRKSFKNMTKCSQMCS